MIRTAFVLCLGMLLLGGCEVRVRDSTPGQSTVFSPDTSLLFSDPNNQPATLYPANPSADDIPIAARTNFYEIVTSMGTMTVRLYDETPEHRDNFKKLVAEQFFDGTTFHRIIPGFMIQGGDPNSKDDDPYNDGIGGPGYTVPAELLPQFYHKKGALAAARQSDEVNPERRSSGSQFYIVQGRPFTELQLNDMEEGMGSRVGAAFQFSPDARRSYLREGGAPFLDMQYTVFGELINGFDTLDRIAQVATGENDRPIEPVTMTIRPAQGL